MDPCLHHLQYMMRIREAVHGFSKSKADPALSNSRTSWLVRDTFQLLPKVRKPPDAFPATSKRRILMTYWCFPLVLGRSVSLSGTSGEGYFLAIGAANDNNDVGASWVFKYEASQSTYRQIGQKLVGSGYEGTNPLQGKYKSGVLSVDGLFKTVFIMCCYVLGSSVSLSEDGSILAVGGPRDDAFIGATWIFKYDGSTYKQLGNKLIGLPTIGSNVQQGK